MKAKMLISIETEMNISESHASRMTSELAAAEEALQKSAMSITLDGVMGSV